MDTIIILCIIAGAAMIGASFIIKEGLGIDSQEKEKIAEEIRSKVLSVESLKKVMDKVEKEFTERLSDVAEDKMTSSTDYMSELTNNKMFAINEMCGQLIEKIEQNHKEVIFLYDMLNEKSDNLKDFSAKVEGLRKELENAGYVKKISTGSKKGRIKEVKGVPLHFVSSDGFDIYVGKNNIQNDYLTFKLASNNDWWFHAKKCAGSHVILITNGREVPGRTFEEAGKLAVHYSSANTSSSPCGDGTKHEVDYVRKKEVKKPNGAKPGFVVYYTNYSLTADSDISGLKQM